jgi:hypothetical protein
VELILPDELITELEDAARERRCSPLQFATETVEAALAERRLPRMQHAHAPRMTEFEESATEG